MRNRAIFILFLFTGLQVAHAQVPVKRHIKKGRRNKSEHQLTIDKNTFEADWEFGDEAINDSLSVFVYPNIVLRYGITGRVEVNMEINPLTTVQKLPAGKKYISGFEPVMPGVRYALLDETKYVPEVALSLQLAPPFLATKSFRAVYWAPLFQCTMQKDFHKKFSLAGSAGIFYDGFSALPNWLYTLTPVYNCSRQLSIGADVFGFAAKNTAPLNNIDANISWQINKSIGIGVTAGTGISHSAHQYYLAINGTWIVFKKKPAAN